MTDGIDHVVYMIWAIWGAIALLALSGLYPAKRLRASTDRISRSSFRIVTALAAIAPLLVYACDWLRVRALDQNRPSGLKNMPMPIESLPLMYVLSAAIAALAFWLILAWRRRAAA